MKKGIENANVVVRKLGPALVRVINEKLEVAKKKRQKKRNGEKAENKSYGRKIPKS